jgi:hypothetical protein
MLVNDCINLLGREAKDKVTGKKGIITTISFDLYGCIQAVMSPVKLKDGDKPSDYIGWYDVNRLEVNTKKKRVMIPPPFDQKYQVRNEVHGPACKPMPRSREG